MTNPAFQPTVLQSLTASANSVPARVTFWLLGVFTLTVIGVFALIGFKVTLSMVMFGVLTGLIATENTLLTGAVGFWLGSSVGAKASGDALAASNLAATSAVATLAGAPPKAPAPTTGTPEKPVVVTVANEASDPVPVAETPKPDADPATPPFPGPPPPPTKM